jgi:hypothetical protein
VPRSVSSDGRVFDIKGGAVEQNAATWRLLVTVQVSIWRVVPVLALMPWVCRRTAGGAALDRNRPKEDFARSNVYSVGRRRRCDDCGPSNHRELPSTEPRC